MEQRNTLNTQTIYANTNTKNPNTSENLYPNNQYSANSHLNIPYSEQSVIAVKKNSDTILTRNLKEHFSFFSAGSLIYAIFYAFCLYRNTSGITYPFFVIGTLCYFFFSIQKLGVPYKKDSIFYIISIILLGISNCLTTSPQLLFMNKCGIFLLSFILILHTIYNDKEWNFPKYFVAFFETIGTCFACIFRPFSDMISYFDAQKQAKTDKKSYLLPVLIGIAIALPLLFIITALLSSADIVFANMLDRVLSFFNFTTIFEIFFLIVIVFFCSYAVYAALCMKNVQENVTDQRKLEPIIAIIVTAALSVVYLMFSVIQIMYLFIGNMQLPEGYTYSGYAREGFFQLLAVCILNLLLVLICLYLFRENIVLKVILTLISGCTYIMILSSALRMIMYINRYNLTFLRIFVLWSLAVIFFLMAGITIFIYNKKFPLFTYGLAIITVFYICLSFAHPDYWIARYNLNPAHLEYLNDYNVYDNRHYLSTLSSDAAVILLNEDKNPYLTEILSLTDEDILTMNDEYLNEYYYLEEEDYESISWIRIYYLNIKYLSENMHVRNFNFSIQTAKKYLF